MGKVVTSGKGQLLGAQGVPNVNHETDSLIFPLQGRHIIVHCCLAGADPAGGSSG